MKLLSELKKFEQAKIKSINENHMINKDKFFDGDVEARLLEMGFIEGAKITVLHKGMWGGEPIAVRINNNNTMISLRKSEASAIIMDEGDK
ncbi:MAG: ferrous iron transport protein A [Burkholderiales bacterium]|nr:ferrous iron transport protein A [Burkholderiales bacterium]